MFTSFLKQLQSLMPPKKVFGLHITDEWIKVLQLSLQSKVPVIKAIEHHDLPQGLVSDGEVLNISRLGQEILTTISNTKPEKLTTDNCVFALPASQSFEHIFYLPRTLKGERFHQKLAELIEENIPIALNELQYDYYVSTLGNIQIVFVVAVRKKIVDQYYHLLNGLCELNPLIAEPESLSLLRNIPLKFKKNEGRILIDIRENSVVWFNIWDQSIFDSNIINKKLLSLDPQILVKDIQASINSFHDLTKRTITNISISGVFPEAKNIAANIKKSLNLPVSIIEKYRLVPVIDDVSFYNEFKIVAGLSLKGLGVEISTQINLFKK